MTTPIKYLLLGHDYVCRRWSMMLCMKLPYCNVNVDTADNVVKRKYGHVYMRARCGERDVRVCRIGHVYGGTMKKRWHDKKGEVRGFSFS